MLKLDSLLGDTGDGYDGGKRIKMLLLGLLAVFASIAYLNSFGGSEKQAPEEESVIVADMEPEETPEEKALRESRSEAGEKYEFVPMDDEFSRVEELDAELLYKVIDLADRRADLAPVANQLKSEADVFYHVFSYIRSHTEAELLQRYEKQDEDPGYKELTSKPDKYRGRVVRYRGQFIRKHQLIKWPAGSELTVRNMTGVNSTYLVFCADLKNRLKVTAFLTMNDVSQYRSGQFVECTGVFVKSWPGLLPDGEWRWFPLVVTADLRKAQMPEPPDYSAWGFILAVGIFVTIVAVAFFGLRDSKESSMLRRRYQGSKNLRLGERSDKGDKDAPGKDDSAKDEEKLNDADK